MQMDVLGGYSESATTMVGFDRRAAARDLVMSHEAIDRAFSVALAGEIRGLTHLFGRYAR